MFTVMYCDTLIPPFTKPTRQKLSPMENYNLDAF